MKRCCDHSAIISVPNRAGKGPVEPGGACFWSAGESMQERGGMPCRVTPSEA